jgi:gamma-glutamyltranspeptidase/glutathione hydrolase
MTAARRRPWGRAAVRTALVALVALAPAAPARAAASSPALGRRAMVVTSQPDATRAGVEVLRAGGNAVDAAIAAALALNVTEPHSTGIGGGAFLLVRLADGRAAALDCRETAPAAATRDMYLRPGVAEDASLFGPLAVATPGIVAGFDLALREWGTRPLAEVARPAIRLAERGFELGPRQAALLAALRARGLPARFPATAAIHFPPDGAPIEPGFRVVQKDLAATLRAISAEGPKTFYEGPIAVAIVGEMARSGGLVTREDLAGYRPVVREPVRGSYRGDEVIAFPPPSSGGVALIQALHVLEGFDLARLGAGSSASLHRIAEALKLAFADRAGWLGDPDFVDVPVAGLLDRAYAAELRRRINPPRWRRAPWTWARDEVAIAVDGPGEPPHDAGTTHLSVVDAAGNAVALTETVNGPYGSWVMVPGTGILLNNEMDDFAKDVNAPNAYGLVDTRGANAIAPGKRPLSSMTPAMVVRDGRVLFVTGSPGGPRIISTTLLSIVNALDFAMDAQAAVSAPRIHHQWIPDRLFVERDVPADVVDALRRRGHDVGAADPWSAAEAIWIDPATGWRHGGSDPRRDGLALGY